jgi:hypothetical protein
MTMRNALLAATLLILAACDRDNSGAVPTIADSAPADSLPAAPVAVPDPGGELRAELGRVLAGQPAETDADTIQSWFSASTAHALRSVTVDSAGHAIVDFHDLRTIIPNASSSAGSTILLQELNTAVFRVPGIRSVEYRIDGSCDAFWEWLQYGCQTVTRESFASGL